MIRITVELVSAISADRNETLGVAEISNVGGTVSRGNYFVRLSKRGRSFRRFGEPFRTGVVEGFPRKRLGGWDLLYLALRECVGDRNK